MNDFEHLPPELQDIARALAAHRDEPDGHLLERVLARVKSAPRPRRRFAGFFRARLAALSMLVLCLGLNVTGALASVLSSLGVSQSTASSLNLSNIVTALTQTVSTGTNSQSAADEVYCKEGGKGGSEENGTPSSEKNGGSDDTTPHSVVTKSATTTSKNAKTGVVTTSYTQTTTTTTKMGDGSGGSESTGGDMCKCPPPTTTGGSEQNGGSEKVDTKVDSYSNGKVVSTTTNTTYQSSGDTSGSENNGGGNCPAPEKPGCGNEQPGQNGLSGASGVHTGQPPMDPERGDCPHQPGVEGPPGYNG